MDLPSDLIDLLAEFDARNVDYLLVGGQAVALHGYPRFTKDADLWLRDTAENRARAIEALRHFGAPEATISGVSSLSGLDVVWMGHPPTRIDLMVSVPGGKFEEAFRMKNTVKVGGVNIHLVNRGTLIALKRDSGRPQDVLDADALAQLEVPISES